MLYTYIATIETGPTCSKSYSGSVHRHKHCGNDWCFGGLLGSEASLSSRLNVGLFSYPCTYCIVTCDFTKPVKNTQRSSLPEQQQLQPWTLILSTVCGVGSGWPATSLAVVIATHWSRNNTHTHTHRVIIEEAKVKGNVEVRAKFRNCTEMGNIIVFLHWSTLFSCTI